MNDIRPSASDASTTSCALAEFSRDMLLEAVSLLDELSCTSVKLLFHVCGLESCARGVCCAKARTLAARMGCSDRTVRRRWSELEASGLVEKVRRRCRTSWRGLTALGRAVIAVAREGGALAVSAFLDRSVSAQVSAHKGDAQPPEFNSSLESVGYEAASPSGSVDPRGYRIPRAAGVLSERAWASVASWLSTARSVSWARCKMAHRAFCRVVWAVHRSREWGYFLRGMAAGRGLTLSAEDLVRLAVDDAVKRGRDFGTVESAMKYIAAVVSACVAERRLPGEGLACSR